MLIDWIWTEAAIQKRRLKMSIIRPECTNPGSSIALHPGRIYDNQLEKQNEAKPTIFMKAQEAML